MSANNYVAQPMLEYNHAAFRMETIGWRVEHLWTGECLGEFNTEAEAHAAITAAEAPSVEATIASAEGNKSEIVTVSRIAEGDVVDMFVAQEIGSPDMVMCPALVRSVERLQGVPATWRIVAVSDDSGSTVERLYVGSTGIVRYAKAGA